MIKIKVDTGPEKFNTIDNINYDLILWNDNVNCQLYVTDRLIDLLGYNFQDAFSIVMRAHKKGSSIAATGNLDYIIKIHNLFCVFNITTTIEGT